MYRLPSRQPARGEGRHAWQRRDTQDGGKVQGKRWQSLVERRVTSTVEMQVLCEVMFGYSLTMYNPHSPHSGPTR